MKQKLLSLLVTLVLVVTGVGSAWAQNTDWTQYAVEPTSGQSYYLYCNGGFLNKEGKQDAIPTVPFIFNGTMGSGDNDNIILYTSDNYLVQIEYFWLFRAVFTPSVKKNENGNIGDIITGAISGWITGNDYELKGTKSSNSMGYNIRRSRQSGNKQLHLNNNGLYCDGNASYDWYFIPVTEAKMFINSSAEYGTFVAPFDITIPEGVTAYTVTSATGTSTTDGVVTFAPVQGTTLTAGTPVVVYKEGGLDETTFYGVSTNDDEIVGSGLLKGVLVDGQTAPKGSYVINYISNKVGFYIVGSENSISVGKNRCYLNGNNTAGGAAKLNIRFEEANAISAVNENATISSIYSASGAKVSSMQKGMNIVKYSDGSVKKIFVK